MSLIPSNCNEEDCLSCPSRDICHDLLNKNVELYDMMKEKIGNSIMSDFNELIIDTVIMSQPDPEWFIQSFVERMKDTCRKRYETLEERADEVPGGRILYQMLFPDGIPNEALSKMKEAECKIIDRYGESLMEKAIGKE